MSLLLRNVMSFQKLYVRAFPAISDAAMP